MSPRQVWVQLPRSRRLGVRRVSRQRREEQAGGFPTRCVGNCFAQKERVLQVEAPKEFQVVNAVSDAELDSQAPGEFVQQISTIARSPPSTLFVFDDLTPDQPVCHHLGRIDRACDAHAGRREDVADATVKTRR